MLKLIVAHRGASNLARENTLEAFQKAVDLGADFIELDVRQTADGSLAVFHDSSINGQKIDSISFKQLQQQARQKNFIVPTLEQVLEFFAGKINFSIEIKAKGYERETAEVAKKFLSLEHFEIISFNFEILARVKELYPEITVNLILSSKGKKFFGLLWFLFHRRKVLSLVNGFCLNWKLMDWKLYKFIPQKYQITLWPVDDPVLLKRFLLNNRVSSITTNRPGMALKIRREII